LLYTTVIDTCHLHLDTLEALWFYDPVKSHKITALSTTN